jgi:membrane protein required for colicin V production
MNVLDFVILGVITFLVIKGIFRGFFREIASLAGIIFGFLVGNHYHPQMAALLKPYIPLEKSLSLIGFIILFFLVFIFFNLLGILMHHLFKRLFIGWFDKSLGLGLALLKGIIICYLLIVLLTFFMPSSSPLIARSKAARLVIVSYQSMASLMSPDLYKTWKQRISKKSDKVGKAISESKEAVKKLPEVLPEKEE